MAIKRNVPPPIEIKVFASADEIDYAIKKLGRRVADVQELIDANIETRSQVVENARDSIRHDIIQIFGENSLQGRSHQYHSIWSGPMRIGMSDYEYAQGIKAGMSETIDMLKGLIKQLEESKEDLPFTSKLKSLESNGPTSDRKHSMPTVQVTLINENKIAIDVQFSVSQLIEKIGDDPTLTQKQKSEASQQLTKLDTELKKPNPNWGAIKKILNWALNFGERVFLQILPIILKHYTHQN